MACYCWSNRRKELEAGDPSLWRSNRLDLQWKWVPMAISGSVASGAANKANASGAFSQLWWMLTALVCCASLVTKEVGLRMPTTCKRYSRWFCKDIRTSQTSFRRSSLATLVRLATSAIHLGRVGYVQSLRVVHTNKGDIELHCWKERKLIRSTGELIRSTGEHYGCVGRREW